MLTPTCTHCGQVGHGSSRDERSDNVAAYSQICTKCGKRGHFAVVCRQQSMSGTRHGQRRSHMSPKSKNATAAVFQSLCSVANAQPIDYNEIICNLRDFELEHCIYDPTLSNPLMAAPALEDCDLWSSHLQTTPHKLSFSPKESLPSRSSETWPTWSSLNRLRTGSGRCKSLMQKRGFNEDGQTTCECGDEQTMKHLLVCPHPATTVYP